MRAPAYFAAVGLLVLSHAGAARADAALDDTQQTVCKGDYCIGSSCNVDGDATNCWQESVYWRKPGEEIHWVCTRHGHHCSWLHGPLPDTDNWFVMRFGSD